MNMQPRNKRDSNRDYALRTIRSNIIDLTLKPGSMVSENELAVELGLSRTPIREALLELSKVSLVEVIPQVGSRIARIDYEMVEEARFLRNVLECSIVELVCNVIRETDKQELLNNVFQQEHFLSAGMPDKIITLDNSFHHMLFKIAQKERLWEIMNGFTAHFDRVRRMAVETVKVKDSKVVADHRAILDCICANKPEEARAVMTKHLLRYKIEEELLRNTYPKEFFK